MYLGLFERGTEGIYEPIEDATVAGDTLECRGFGAGKGAAGTEDYDKW